MIIFSNNITLNNYITVPTWAVKSSTILENIDVAGQIITLSNNNVYLFNGRFNLAHYVNRYTNGLWFYIYMQQLIDGDTPLPYWQEISGTRTSFVDTTSYDSYFSFAFHVKKYSIDELVGTSKYRFVLESTYSSIIQNPFTKEYSEPATQSGFPITFNPLELSILEI